MHEHGAEAGASLFDIAFDVVQDAVVDTLYLIPFLFVTYLAMEWLEHKTGRGAQEAVRKAGVAGPAIGALLGVVPQCGFSAAASTLYAGRVIGLGTLFAVYLSTSDEMLPIFIAEQVAPEVLLTVVGWKIAIGMVFGFIVDAVLRLRKVPQDDLRIHELCEHDRCDCNDNCSTCKDNPAMAYSHHDDCAHGCNHEHHLHEHSHDDGWAVIFKSAVKHTVQVTLFVLVVSLALNAVLAVVGEEVLAEFIGSNGVFAVVLSSIVGLIPNCAASVAIAQLYVEGVLSFGPMIAGLLSAAGVGLIVLFRANRHPLENLAIIVTLVVVSSVCGIAFELTGYAL